MIAVHILLQLRIEVITVKEILIPKNHHFIAQTQVIVTHIQVIMWKIIIRKQMLRLMDFECLQHHLVILCLIVERELVMLIKIRNVIIQCCQYLLQWIVQQILLIMINKGYQSQNLQY